MTFVPVAKLAELSQSDALVVELEGRQIALFLSNGEVYAYDNFCPHRGGPLGEGLVRDGCVTCPWHDWTFELKSGRHVRHAGAMLTRYASRISGDDVLVCAVPVPQGE